MLIDNFFVFGYTSINWAEQNANSHRTKYINEHKIKLSCIREDIVVVATNKSGIMVYPLDLSIKRAAEAPVRGAESPIIKPVEIASPKGYVFYIHAVQQDPEETISVMEDDAYTIPYDKAVYHDPEETLSSTEDERTAPPEATVDSKETVSFVDVENITPPECDLCIEVCQNPEIPVENIPAQDYAASHLEGVAPPQDNGLLMTATPDRDETVSCVETDEGIHLQETSGEDPEEIVPCKEQQIKLSKSEIKKAEEYVRILDKSLKKAEDIEQNILKTVEKMLKLTEESPEPDIKKLMEYQTYCQNEMDKEYSIIMNSLIKFMPPTAERQANQINKPQISATSTPIKKSRNPKNNTIADKFETDAEGMVIIGPNGTKVAKTALQAINWCLSGAAITRKILVEVFGRKTLSSHTLTGKPSPAFLNCDKPIKNQLCPLKVADIINLVTQHTQLTVKEVKNAITTKCADENKMLRQKVNKSRKSALSPP